MRTFARTLTDDLAHYLPVLGAALGILVAAVTVAFGWAMPTGPGTVHPSAVAVDLTIYAAAIALAARHRPWRCRQCLRTPPGQRAPGRAHRWLLTRHLTHPLGRSRHIARCVQCRFAVHFGGVLAAYAVLCVLVATGPLAVAMGYWAAALLVWSWLGATHRTWRAWCPACHSARPHSLSGLFAANMRLVHRFCRAHEHCVLVFRCATGDCGQRLTTDWYDTDGHRTATDWYAHHLDTHHPNHDTIELAMTCRDHDSTAGVGGYWPEAPTPATR